MNPKVKELLNQITAWMEANPKLIEPLWDILSALRGPDSLDEWKYKSSLTNVIRFFALPSKELYQKGLVEISPDSSRLVEKRQLIDARTSHYLIHSANAFKALGLNWDKENK